MRVLVVEDNALLRHHLKVQLQDAGHGLMMLRMQRKQIITLTNICQILRSST